VDLKLKDVATLLQVSQKTIYRWVNEGKIPFYRINHQYRFKTDDLQRWSLGSKYSFQLGNECSEIAEHPVCLLSSLRKGGIFYNISGSNVAEILQQSVEMINLPPGIDANILLSKLKDREAMASTAIGDGIAFPHPRTPLVENIADETVSLCFLDKPINFNAIDNKPVDVIFIILSADQTRHLRLLAKLSYSCRQPAFVKLLKQQALRKDLYNYLQG
jgi:PTS system nitrogen regulatory IIA component